MREIETVCITPGQRAQETRDTVPLVIFDKPQRRVKHQLVPRKLAEQVQGNFCYGRAYWTGAKWRLVEIIKDQEPSQ